MKRVSFALQLLGGLGALLFSTASWAQAEPPPLPTLSPSAPADAPPQATEPVENNTETADGPPAESAAPEAPSPLRSGFVVPPYQATLSPIEDVEPLPETRYEQRDLSVEGGFRGVIVTGDGFDPYAANDVLPAFAVTGTYLPFKTGPFSFGGALEYDIGGQASTARGKATSLTAHRASVGVEARAALFRRFHAYAKVAPSAMYMHATINDGALSRPLVANTWTWNVDTTVGGAFLMSSAGNDDAPAVRLWLAVELGYAFAGAAQMQFSPEDDDEDPRKFGSIDLPDLRLGGFVNRIALALTF